MDDIRKRLKVSATISHISKKEIESLVEKGNFQSISAFVREGIDRLLSEITSGSEKDILNEDSMKRFIEEIS